MCQKPDMKQYTKHDGPAVTKDIRPQIKLCRKEEFENLWPQIFKFLFAAQFYLRSYVFCNGRAVVFSILFHIRLLAHIVF